MLEIRQLTLRHADRPLLVNMNLSVQPGEIVTLTGVSGAGKSTLLNWLIGNLDPAFTARGELWLNGRQLDQRVTEARGIGILFQDDLLFPHLSVGQNLAFALPATVAGVQRQRQVQQTLAEVGLAGFHDRDPTTLSGGQRARVSLMRALLAQPQALLLDEPFSKLDATLRLQFRQLVFAQIGRLGVPTLLVTHDPADVPPDGRVMDLSHWQTGDV
ncbi:ATP-binding cassette domain-containing protein [Rhodoferax sp.]|uniref:ATP-binding cassette domain-containing protein n=1 Tax=Rhodoferax sp. TaxID=50421 RepID=UPI00261AB7C1|nr:ATP-binding cassette domain-containing protein [Rhodoferax sp.]MDD2923963.1 ATP-binding cassette domain-containing protein [Rhodoferax sp.]